MITNLTRQQAIEMTRRWLDTRTDVRQHLIAEARFLHPATPVGEDWPSNAVRKLHQYPFDLTERQLIALIDNP